MNLYIDKENVLSLIKDINSNGSDFKHQDCARMLSRQLALKFNFRKEEVASDESLMNFMQLIADGRGNKEVIDEYRDEPFPVRPLKSNCYTLFSSRQLMAVYLLNDDNIDKLKEKNALLVGKVGEEIKVLSKLLCGNDYDFQQIYHLKRNFDSWNRLQEDGHCLPLTDIVIQDNFLFKSHDVLDHNIYKLLPLLVANCDHKVNIFIVTRKEESSLPWKELVDRLVKIISEKTQVKPSITIVLTNRNNSDDKTHDRFILTNYRLFQSGDSFAYFQSSGKRITKGDFFSVYSLAKSDYFDVAQSLIEDAMTLYKSKEGLNSDLIIKYPEKETTLFNVLNFSDKKE